MPRVRQMCRSTERWAALLSLACALAVAGCSTSAEDIPSAAADSSTPSPQDGTVAPDGGSGDAFTTDSGAADATVSAPEGSDASDSSADADGATSADAADGAASGDASDGGGAADAGVDSGPPGCVSAGTPVTRPCGLCGTQSATCTAVDGGGDGGGDGGWDGGTLEQGAFGACTGERDGGCVPGTEVPGGDPCARCGRARRVCNAECVYDVGRCVVPPTAVCNPGERTFRVGLSCPNANEGRYETCGSECTFSMGECTLEQTWVSVSSSVGTTASRPFTLRSTKTIARGGTSAASGVCTAGTAITPYETTVIRNTTGKALKIAVWESFPPGMSGSVDTVLNVFRGEGIPTGRTGCLGANDTCSSSPCSGGGLAGLVGSSAVTIGVGETLTAFSSCYSTSCTTPSELALNVRTLEILP